jgi:hypothetical protein
VFVRRAEVESGVAVFEDQSAVHPNVIMGRVLPGGARAPNKGSIGIALTYYNTAIAFLNSHLASDSGNDKSIPQ